MKFRKIRSQYLFLATVLTLGTMIAYGLLAFALLDRETRVLTERSLQTMATIVGGEAAANPDQERLLADAAQQQARELKRLRQRGLLAFVMIGAGLMLLTLVLAWWMAGRITEPLETLAINADRVGGGDFGITPSIDRSDEIGLLAKAFEHMRDALRSTTVSRDHLDKLLNSMPDAVVVTSSDGIIKRCNEAATSLLDQEEGALQGEHIRYLFAESARSQFSQETLSNTSGESRLLRRNGEEIPVSYSSATVFAEDSEHRSHLFVARNISDQKRAERRIRYLARYDALTRIPNRMQFQHMLQRTLARSRKKGYHAALLYIDLDRFKDVNDTFGHLTGDRCLVAVAERMVVALPKDTVVGRLAGDEFGVVLTEIPARDQARRQVAELLRDVLAEISQAYFHNDQEIFVAASAGVAFFPEDADNVIDLIRNADAAMYEAKRQGGHSFEFYKPEMNATAVDQLMLRSKLRRALERDEFLLRYQPKIDIRDGRVVGAEALLRWHLPDRGEVAPAEFIPLAEESSLILAIGEWVVAKVCDDFKEWRKHVRAPGRIAMNLSLRQLRQKNLVDGIAQLFKQQEVSPTCFEFEITESTLMEDPEMTVRLLNQLYALGVHLSIDDFGTGYSSLSSLQKFPINTLKIDQSFVQDAAVDPDAATIVSTIIEMGRSLKMDVVAEGVESEIQLNFLREHDCHYVQGHLFGLPVTADEYLQILIGDLDGSNRHRALFG